MHLRQLDNCSRRNDQKQSGDRDGLAAQILSQVFHGEAKPTTAAHDHVPLTTAERIVVESKIKSMGDLSGLSESIIEGILKPENLCSVST